MTAVGLASLGVSAASAATIGYALGSGGSTLIRFDAANVGGATATSLSTPLDAIDFRPATGQLFGYSSAADAYYTVDTATGVVTPFPVSSGATVAPTSGGNVDIDWNPTIDRMRTVGSENENIVFNPTTGGAAAQTALFYQSGDVNFGTDPLIAGNAYTNNFAGATTTQQYVLDYGLNTIATLGNNAGTLGTLGGLTLNGAAVDFNADIGFDIATIGGANMFFAILNRGGLSALFTIDIATRELTQLGVFAGEFGPLSGLAISPEIPLPAGVLLFLTGIAGLFAAKRRGSGVAA